ncbi:VOC family protein [Rhodobacterales bacterium HKCCE4037]|nr:VOC family protein [Rhodobacterales bacterium HKCCE4037]
MPAQLEHLNITVADPAATADMLTEIFGWRIRWQGDAKGAGFTIHVGTEDTYVALYNPRKDLTEAGDSYTRVVGLNHMAVVVDDLDAIEAKVKERGYEPHSHADYEPGRRFYFHEENGLEIEVVQY